MRGAMVDIGFVPVLGRSGGTHGDGQPGESERFDPGLLIEVGLPAAWWNMSNVRSA
jgi:hypothetical protein